MAQKIQPGDGMAGPDPTETECLLSWRSDDGAVTSVGPLSRDRAETLLQVYGRMYPDQTCWVQPLPPEVEDLHLGRVRRSRSLPLLDPSDRDH